MPRPVTLFTGQWADLPLEKLCEMVSQWGYDGLELACWGDHFEVDKALADDDYCKRKHDLLASYGLSCFAISNHLVGQAVSDPIDPRHKSIVPERIWGDGSPAGVNARAAQEMIDTARAARKFGVDVVNGFTGSPVWHKLYFFPPTTQDEIDEGYETFAKQWTPILDAFEEEGIRFALEVHPTEIAYDIYTFDRALDALDGHDAFAINFDPSHLIWQGLDPVKLIDVFPDRIAHVHIKDAARTLDGATSILGSHLAFGDAGRGWDFRSPGRGEVDFEGILRSLNRIGYEGPLSVEWEDSAMAREHGAMEAVEFVKAIDFPPAGRAFDSAFDKERDS
ncbi:MAG: sugar phosphate isomerase/epimerase family protein [Phycisphaerales bacterium JB061]